MLIYGRSKWNLKRTESLFTEKCSNCGKSGSVDVQVYTKYAHVFWVPFFPLPKEILAVCISCKQVQTAKEMPAHVREIALDLKKQVKPPIYYWIGAALFAWLVISVVMSIQEDNKKTAEYAANPKAEDIYEIKLSSGSYTLFKVKSISGDTVYFSINEYESTKETGLTKSEMNKEESFLPLDSPITKKQIIDKLSKGEILKVRRKGF
jgi:hypothetical protein